ncbi:MAG: hydroxyacid dehydrogenase [Candidatus Roizmanbacteria bacterium]
MLIYVTEKDGIDTDALEVLTRNNHTIMYELQDKKEEVEVLFFRTYTQANEAFLSQFPQLKYILRAGTGIENIDADYCKNKNITVINSPGANANAVAEFVILAILTLYRKLPQHMQNAKEGKWRDFALLGEEMKGKTLGLIGCGHIGRLVAQKIRGFEIANVIGYDPYLTETQLAVNKIEKKELVDVITQSDILSIHVPLTDETKNLLSAKELATMKPSSIIINTSRGGIVNEEDLIHTIKEKIISGVALDVFTTEPTINLELLQYPNILCTPHIGALTLEANKSMSMQVVQKFLKMCV